jgi:hypothetical protein
MMKQQFPCPVRSRIQVTYIRRLAHRGIVRVPCRGTITHCE